MSASEAATARQTVACVSDYDCDCASSLCEAANMKNNSKRKSDSQEGTLSSTGFNYINPFVHKLQIDDTFDLVKIYMLSVLLLPFRVVGCILFLLIAWVFASITLHGLTLDDLKQKPLSGWRRHVQKAVSYSMRLLYASGSFHYVKFIGERASSKEAPILVVAPHSSYVDSMVVVMTGPSSIVAKQETSNIPLLGKIINCSQPIYVLREDPNSRQNTIKEITSRAHSKEEWPQVVIFSEGTCTNRSALIKFKPGAFYPGVPVQPVLLRYPSKYDTYTWTWDGPGVIRLVWLTLTKLYSRCEVEFLPVYTPSAEEKANAKLFANNVRAVMAKAMDVPTSDYSFEDCIIMNRAKEMKIPFPGEIVEIERTLFSLGLLNSSKNEELLPTYCNLQENRDISLGTFAEMLSIDINNQLLIQLFAILDQHRRGTISLRNYLLCSFYCKSKNEDVIEFLRPVANLYALSTQSISRENFYKIVRHSGRMTQKQSDVLFFSIDYTSKGHISFDELENFTKDKPQYEFLHRKQEHVRRAWK